MTTSWPRSVIIFGASGFVGQNLLSRLNGQVDRIIAVARGEAQLGVDCEVCDVNSLSTLDPGQDAAVIHLAAHRYDASNFRTGQSDILLANTALAGTVYQFCIEKEIRELRVASSIAVYDSNQTELRDDVPLDLSQDPFDSELLYGWSKRYAEVMAHLYQKKYGINTVSFRLSNPYGPMDCLIEDKAHVVPAFVIRALTTEGDFGVRGNPHATRDFVFVDDVCRAFEASLAWRERQDQLNVGTGTNSTIQELAETVIDLSGTNRSIVSTGKATSDVLHRRVDVARLKQACGLDSMVSLRDGLEVTMNWYREALPK